MKLTLKPLSICAATMLAVQAFAGQFGIDPYAGFRTVVTATTPVTIGAANGAGVTNGPIDTFNWIGDAKIDVFAYTNAQVNTVTITLQQSTDTTNWSNITNVSVASAASLKVTNTIVLSGSTYILGNTNFVVTDNLLYPFTITTPTAFSAGYATPYGSENPFTNSTPVTLNPNGWSEIGLHTGTLMRYVQAIFTAGGAGTTNVTASAVITVPVYNTQP